ncbi:MAG: methyltransferase domain-containing protein [Flavobacteriales bacterium]|nr:methyltransferase domain-containing protein [Leptospiraceae bacterium]MCB9336304.1 methyltransferase domain-containing protein [Flavobacteriales bacterium]
MKSLINKLHKSKVLGSIIHTLDYCLQKELENCETALDLGCGPSSPLQYCKNIKYSVGVEAFPPYLEKSISKKIHTKYISKKIEELDFPKDSFDAVIMIEVLEHLPEKTGYEILKKIELWAKKKIIVSSPNGFIAQKEVDGNPLQKHLSGWDVDKMKSLGFRSRGLAGLKALRQEVQNDTMGDDLLNSIRYRPKVFWFLFTTLSQIIVYYYPKLAFGLFNVKEK